jgi:hypothetical protein
MSCLDENRIPEDLWKKYLQEYVQGRLLGSRINNNSYQGEDI